MSHPIGYPLRDRIEVEFIEADVETGFALVDMAGDDATRGDPALAQRVLESADRVLVDIHQRLGRLGAAHRAPFAPLVTELEAQIGRVKRLPT